jgi:hypothetical protein
MLSKTRIMAGEQCDKRLWLEVHNKGLRTIDPSMQARFDQGHAFGALARQQLGPGTLVEHPDDQERALEDSAALLNSTGPLTLFEPAVAFGDVLVRADVLTRDAQGHFALIEVKSSTKVKDEHLLDAAIQCWVLEGAGLSLGQIEIAHVNNAFVYAGGGKYDGIVSRQDVTAEVRGLLSSVPAMVKKALSIVAGNVPAIPTGPHCHKPYECAFYPHCSAQGPQFPVWWIPRIGEKRVLELLARGIRDVAEVPRDVTFTEKQQRVVDATRMNRVYIDRTACQDLSRLAFPRFYLDFESAAPCIPFWASTRPYEQVPFQFSCVIERTAGIIETTSWLSRNSNLPLRELAEALLDALGDHGPIIVYSGFEKTRIGELVKRFPDLGPRLRALQDRLYDLSRVVADAYYHPSMRGSYSIKDVLPTVTDQISYAGLETVTDGSAAATAFMKTLATETNADERERLRNELVRYCDIDAMAMRMLCEHLAKQ